MRPRVLRRFTALGTLALSALATLAPLAPLAHGGDTWVEGQKATRDSKVVYEGADAIWYAISTASAGDRIRVSAGTYPGGDIGGKIRQQHTPGPQGTESMPVLVEAFGKVIIGPHAYGPKIPNVNIHGGRWVTFRGFEIQTQWIGLSNYPVRNSSGAWEPMTGWRFEDCSIVGSYDHIGRRGEKPKWGFLGWMWDRVAWVGGEVRDIHHEHAFYVHNPAGWIRFQRVRAARLGRTFLQVRNAPSDSGYDGMGPGRGEILIEDCTIEDAGIADGGSAITVAGRHEGAITIRRTEIRAGFDAMLKAAVRSDGFHANEAPFAAGAIAIWSEQEGWTNGPVTIEDVRITYAPDAGDRPLIQVGGTLRLVARRNTITCGMHKIALDVGRGGPGYAPVPDLVLEQNTIEGQVWVSGERRP